MTTNKEYEIPNEENTLSLRGVSTKSELRKLLSHSRTHFKFIDLTLYDSFIEPFSFEIFEEFSQLKSVSVYGGSFKEIDTSAINQYPLEYFAVLKNKRIEDVDLRPFLKLPSIMALSISNSNNVKSVRMENIGECKSLRLLFVASKRYNPDLSLISRCTSLQSLMFHDNTGHIDLKPLEKLKKLRTLEIFHDVRPLDKVRPLDCTPLLGLPDLVYLGASTRIGARDSFSRITLPEAVSKTCGRVWPRVNEWGKAVKFKRTPKKMWEAFKKYAATFIPIYWSELNERILQYVDMPTTTDGIKIAHCVIPSDLMKVIQTISDNVRFERSKIVNQYMLEKKRRQVEILQKHLPDLIERYLDGGHTTIGFDTDILEDHNEYDVYVPRILEMRKKELYGIEFIQKHFTRISRRVKFNEYFIHPLLDTVYGKQVIEKIKKNGGAHPRTSYVLLKEEIEEIESLINDDGYPTDWRFLTRFDYIRST